MCSCPFADVCFWPTAQREMGLSFRVAGFSVAAGWTGITLPSSHGVCGDVAVPTQRERTCRPVLDVSAPICFAILNNRLARLPTGPHPSSRPLARAGESSCVSLPVFHWVWGWLLVTEWLRYIRSSRGCTWGERSRGVKLYIPPHSQSIGHRACRVPACGW